ncbi:hypothetical protein H257_08870 [Aphanomyces astaci]|uniref:DDE-1 domain-containing protein n=1 Tax=Aphanomyces astaci TaxID=112090 RepID=W4GCQ3_APHAT|nr:hypothetical protein H257_08870 [Aphanomyces astaci]ETV77455.1 hypothetical protein H257_08870 [Aphanomyces astaci]|eukprot:XP_009833242.1 hypothetical protein H257_08870 [Aphanomyces astaci]
MLLWDDFSAHFTDEVVACAEELNVVLEKFFIIGIFHDIQTLKLRADIAHFQVLRHFARQF